jgi:hypothetical protein
MNKNKWDTVHFSLRFPPSKVDTVLSAFFEDSTFKVDSVPNLHSLKISPSKWTSSQFASLWRFQLQSGLSSKFAFLKDFIFKVDWVPNLHSLKVSPSKWTQFQICIPWRFHLQSGLSSKFAFLEDFTFKVDSVPNLHSLKISPSKWDSALPFVNGWRNLKEGNEK